MLNQFAKKWDYELRVRDVFAAADELPTAAETIAMGKQVADRIRALQAKMKEGSDLWHDLDGCAEAFLGLEGIENAYEARDLFNEAMTELYDQGDYAKRVWVA